MKITPGKTYLTQSGSLREVIDIRMARDGLGTQVVFWRILEAPTRAITGFTDLDLFEDICVAEQETFP